MPANCTIRSRCVMCRQSIHTFHGWNTSTHCCPLAWTSMRKKWSSSVCHNFLSNSANCWIKRPNVPWPTIWCGVWQHSRHFFWPKSYANANWSIARPSVANKSKSHAGRSASTSPAVVCRFRWALCMCASTSRRMRSVRHWKWSGAFARNSKRFWKRYHGWTTRPGRRRSIKCMRCQRTLAIRTKSWITRRSKNTTKIWTSIRTTTWCRCWIWMCLERIMHLTNFENRSTKPTGWRMHVPPSSMHSIHQLRTVSVSGFC